ncbi:unnamed protein product [Trichogramma brassicae]|uniref:Retrovirus-related Pol polyprotein from transposon TNT 1-94 n=1 Tax=Trichogramma brassicae TaxID=86971 RepID=A0A6H5II87_9HYME|nr:unnamed protein product [Trichogramma brassicae]
MEPSEPVVQYTTKVMNMARTLKDLGEKISDAAIIAKILGGLSTKFSNFVTAWDSVDEEKQTLSFLQERLIKEENKLQGNDDEMSALAVVRESKNGFRREKSSRYPQQKHSSENQRSESRACYHCNKPGHLKANCRIRQRDLKRNKQRDNNRSNHGKDSNARVGFVYTFENEEISNVCAFSEGASHWTMPDEIMRLDASESWFSDSGASQHITSRREWFHDLVESSCEESIFLGDDKACKIKGSGTIIIDRYINGKKFRGQLENVLFIPDIKKNLLSIGACTRKGFEVTFTGNIVKFTRDGQVEGVGMMQSNNIYRMFFKVVKPCEVNVAAGALKWHERLGHVNQKKMHDMISKNLITGVSINEKSHFSCDPCQTAKSHRLPFDKDRVRAACRVGEYFHSDVCGPMPEDSLGGARFFLTFKDEASGYLQVYFLRHKSDVVDNFRSFERAVNNKFGRTMRALRCDQGREYCNNEMKKTMDKYGIKLETTAPYTPEKNGQAERVNRTIVEMARSMMLQAKAPGFLWAEAVNTAAHIVNRLSTRARSNTTPFEAWWGKKPDMSNMRIFGALAYSHIPKQFRKKFDPKAKRTWMVGYNGDSRNYRLYDPSSRKIIISRNVTFNEENLIGTSEEKEKTPTVPLPIFPSSESDDPKERSSRELDEPIELDDEVGEHIAQVSVPEDVTEKNSLAMNSSERDSRKRKADEMKLSRINLRDRTLIKKPKRLGLVADAATMDVVEPYTYGEATSGSDAKEWRHAIEQELQSLDRNGTWIVVPRPKDRRVIDSKWVFKFQEEKAGKPRKYKARLCARGFRQQEGVDFQETFAPVIRYDATRIMLAMAAQLDLDLIQFDVASAFLHGELEEEVYMEPPLGTNIPKNHVYMWRLTSPQSYMYNLLVESRRRRDTEAQTQRHRCRGRGDEIRSAQHFWRSRYRAGGSYGDKLSWLVVSSFSAKMLDAFILRRVGAAARKVSRSIADARQTTIALSRRAVGRTPAVAEADEVFDGSDRPGVHGRTEITRGMRRSSCSFLSMLSVIVMSEVETVTGIPVTRTSQESTLGVVGVEEIKQLYNKFSFTAIPKINNDFNSTRKSIDSSETWSVSFFSSQKVLYEKKLTPRFSSEATSRPSCKPLCMLDTAGKILERIICDRLEATTESPGGLSDHQYGFRKGRSTINAIENVIATAQEAIAGKRWNHGTKKYCARVTLDVKNEFNFARWNDINAALRRMRTPEYLLRIVGSYLSARKLDYDTDEGPESYRVTAGVPQGSVLGPILWNVMCDAVLRLNFGGNVKIVRFADDIALMTVAKHRWQIEYDLSSTIE